MDAENDNAELVMIEFKCPYCRETTSFLETDAGLASECPFCGQILIVPKASCEVGGRLIIPVTTARLALRMLNPGDLDDLARIVTDEEQPPYDSWSFTDETQMANWLDAQSQTPFAQGKNYLALAIEVADSQKFIGLASFQYIDQTRRQGQISLTIDRPEQREGYGREAVRGLLDFGFGGLGLRRMTGICDDRNTAFIALAAKAGFRQEGAFFGDRFVNGEWINTAYFAMLEEDYQKAGKG
jgi:RimJ/RimL family protein N-acetyltransferase